MSYGLQRNVNKALPSEPAAGSCCCWTGDACCPLYALGLKAPHSRPCALLQLCFLVGLQCSV